MTLFFRVLPHLHIEQAPLARTLPPTTCQVCMHCTLNSTVKWTGICISGLKFKPINHSPELHLKKNNKEKLDFKLNLSNQTSEKPATANTDQRKPFSCVPAYSHV